MIAYNCLLRLCCMREPASTDDVIPGPIVQTGSFYTAIEVVRMFGRWYFVLAEDRSGRCYMVDLFSICDVPEEEDFFNDEYWDDIDVPEVDPAIIDRGWKRIREHMDKTSNR